MQLRISENLLLAQKLVFLLFLSSVFSLSSQAQDVMPSTNEITTDLTTVSSVATTSLPISLEPESSNEIDQTVNSTGSKRLINDRDWIKLAQVLRVNKTKVPVLRKFGHKIENIYHRVEADNGHIRPEVVVQEFLPDPMRVKDIPVNKEDGWLSTYRGLFSNVTMYGVKNVQITSIKANVGKLNAKIYISIPSVYLTGNYELDGSVSFVSIGGNGKFRFNISEIEIEAFGNLNRTESGHLQIGNIELDVHPGEMNIDLENLSVMGSEGLAQTIVSTMSDIIFSTVKYTVLEKTSNKIRGLINQRLEKISLNMITQSSESLFDDILAFAEDKISDKMEPLKLPAFNRTFERTILRMIPIHVLIQVDEGQLYGLTTLARTGDIYVTYEDEIVMIEAEVGFKNLTGKYNWKLNVMGKGPSGSASLLIRKVSAYVRIAQQMKRGAVPKLERVRVEEIDHVWMDLDGLGVWDHLLEVIVNSVSNVFRMSIANLITSTVTKVLQEALDKGHISFIP